MGDDAATVNNFNNAIDTGNGHNVIVHGALEYDEVGGITFVLPKTDGLTAAEIANLDPIHTNPAQIAQAVKSNPNYVEGSQVCFASCWSGSSGTAQQLADGLGAPVFAPTRPVAWDSTGNKWIFDTDKFPIVTNPNIKPEWKMFYPTKSK